MNYYQWNIRFG